MDNGWDRICEDAKKFISEHQKDKELEEGLRHVEEQVRNKTNKRRCVFGFTKHIIKINLDLFEYSPIHLIIILNKVLKLAIEYHIDCIIRYKKMCKPITYKIAHSKAKSQPLNFILSNESIEKDTWNGLFEHFTNSQTSPKVEAKVEIIMLLLLEVSRRLDEGDAFKEIPIITCFHYIVQNFVNCRELITTKTKKIKGRTYVETASLFQSKFFPNCRSDKVEDRMNVAKQIINDKLEGKYDLSELTKKDYFSDKINNIIFSREEGASTLKVVIQTSLLGKTQSFESSNLIDNKLNLSFKQEEYEKINSHFQNISLDDFDTINSKIEELAQKDTNQSNLFLLKATRDAILRANVDLDELDANKEREIDAKLINDIFSNDNPT